MEKMNAFLWTLVGLFVVSIIISIIASNFSIAVFFGVVIIVIDYFIVYVILKLSYKKKENEFNDKGKFNYCWNKMNELLSRMPNGNSVDWWGGVGRTSVIKSYLHAGKTRSFRSMYGLLSHEKQGVVIIWDIDNEDIAGYFADPSAEILVEPFKFFKPVETETQIIDRFGRNTKGYLKRRYPGFDGRKNRGVNINIDSDNNFNDDVPDEFVTAATGKGQDEG